MSSTLTAQSQPLLPFLGCMSGCTVAEVVRAPLNTSLWPHGQGVLLTLIMPLNGALADGYPLALPLCSSKRNAACAPFATLCG